METLPFVLNVSIGNPQLEITISKTGTVSIPVSRYLHRGTFTGTIQRALSKNNTSRRNLFSATSHQIIGVP